MTNWVKITLGDAITLQRGHDLPKTNMNHGCYPVAGSNGIIGWHDKFTTKAIGVTIGRSGNIGNAYIYNTDFWAHNTTLYVKDFKGNDPVFIYYFLKNIDFNSFNAGSAVPTLNRNHIHPIPIFLPPLTTQKAIAEVLSSLDDKIDLLHRQNKTLEQMAETLFRQRFVEEAGEDWEMGTLGEVINIYDNKRIPLSKMQRDKMKDGVLYPYYGAAKIMDYVNEYIFDGEYILLGEDGTVQTEEGYPILQYATGKFWVNNHTHVITAKEPYNNFFLWNFLSKLNVTNVVTGAVQPKINQSNLKAIGFPKFPELKVKNFNKTTSELFQKVNLNTNQINVLSNLRDTILPKLISGEIKLNINTN
jgi:type I restriction enzyme, S subunit